MRDIENIVILTGAGISAESGVATFRGPDGLWEGHRVEDRGWSRRTSRAMSAFDPLRTFLLDIYPPRSARHENPRTIRGRRQVNSFQALSASAALFLFGCSDIGSSDQRRSTGSDDEELTRYEAMVRASDGRVGTFEGVYEPHVEGSAFRFCSAAECPDYNQLECHPRLSKEASNALAEIDNQAGVHMVVSGRISAEPNMTYGHMSAQPCEISVDRVLKSRVMKNRLVRSRKFPSLTHDDPELTTKR